MQLRTKIIKAGGGDAIIIGWKNDNSDMEKHILTDGGGKMVYNTNLKEELKQIIRKGECLELLIVTHVDMDHIGGIIKIFDDIRADNLYEYDNEGKKSFLRIKEIWFNANSLLKDRDFWLEHLSNKTGINQGADLQLYLENCENHVKALIARPEKYENRGGVAYYGNNQEVKLTILSPTKEYIIDYHKEIENDWKNAVDKWLKTKHKISKSDSEQKRKNKLSIRELIEENRKIEKDKANLEEKETAPPNISSIAYIFECKAGSILMLGDAPAENIVLSLIDLGYSKQKPIKVDFVKLAHHGGIKNTSFELLARIIHGQRIFF